MIIDNKDKYYQLREKYPVFTYKNFFYSVDNKSISITFEFDLSGKYTFRPSLNIDLKSFDQCIPNKESLDNLVFQIGMIELISYWKLTCSTKLIIEPFQLNKEQVDFWTKLYFHGLGEFFYLNNISVKESEFISIQSSSEKQLKKIEFDLDAEKVLVPVGGGKDSNVSLQLLKNRFSLIPFIVNPRAASMDSSKVAGYNADQIFILNRKLDPLMIELNAKGFLNGHTPFSALLGFVSLLAAAFTQSKYIALSNESSANEPTIKDGPNHQYSKSYEFEKDFRTYVNEYISEEIQYFSFLRPLSELQIARLFSQNEDYFPVFKSCNVGSKTDSWCGQCPKCLFTCIILSPFIHQDELQNIFGSNLFEKQKLIPVLEELTGISPVKPFECVGTVDEVVLALSFAVDNYPKPMPVLLEYFQKTKKYSPHAKDLLSKELKKQEAEHFVPQQFYQILTNALDVS